jgi:hypothetical protein
VWVICPRRKKFMDDYSKLEMDFGNYISKGNEGWGKKEKKFDSD